MIIALVDANNFYCSCERVFQPRLEKRPVLVLSNNDGCAIARSQEVKDLGVKMGDPYFKIRELCRRNGVVVFSSNYALYGDMSRRVQATLAQFSPRVEAYSIDESFLDFAGMQGNLTDYAQTIRATVKQWTGIPTCVGIGPTKTLAKIANHAAKKQKCFGDVCDVTDPATRDAVLAWIPVQDIWGIGRASAAQLAAIGVTTGAELRNTAPHLARQLLTVVGERIVNELRGIPCLELEEIEPQRKGMAVTRSFGEAVTTLDGMLEAVSTYATRAGEKLRARGLAAAAVTVFMQTNRFNGDQPYSGARTIEPAEATDDTLALVGIATLAARRIWRGGFRYSKAGILLNDLVKVEGRQRSLLVDPVATERRRRLMKAVDHVNAMSGRGTLFPAAAGIRKAWSLRADHRSPRWTTRIADLPEVR